MVRDATRGRIRVKAAKPARRDGRKISAKTKGRKRPDVFPAPKARSPTTRGRLSVGRAMLERIPQIEAAQLARHARKGGVRTRPVPFLATSASRASLQMKNDFQNAQSVWRASMRRLRELLSARNVQKAGRKSAVETRRVTPVLEVGTRPKGARPCAIAAPRVGTPPRTVLNADSVQQATLFQRRRPTLARSAKPDTMPARMGAVCAKAA